MASNIRVPCQKSSQRSVKVVPIWQSDLWKNGWLPRSVFGAPAARILWWSSNFCLVFVKFVDLLVLKGSGAVIPWSWHVSTNNYRNAHGYRCFIAGADESLEIGTPVIPSDKLQEVQLPLTRPALPELLYGFRGRRVVNSNTTWEAFILKLSNSVQTVDMVNS